MVLIIHDESTIIVIYKQTEQLVDYYRVTPPPKITDN